MKVETKFNVGESVWMIDQKCYNVQCPTCDGKKRVCQIDVHPKLDAEVTCGHCGGTGEVYAEGLRWEPRLCEITDIGFGTGRFHGRTEGVEIVYYIKQVMSSGSKPEEMIFATAEEAQVECDRRNVEERGKQGKRG